jgi:4-amino-4-deoxy-L-arabinose transferase-like glycosyltransferase
MPGSSKIIVMKSDLPHWQIPRLPLAILGLAFSLRLYRLDFQSIWWDEGHSIFVAQHPLTQIPTLPAMDVHPPAYFALLHGWLALTGPSEFALRYLSVLFGMLTVALLWRFGRELGPSRLTPALAMFFAAISPLYVAYAQEVRGYGMLTFLALSSTFFLWRLINEKTPSPQPSPRGRGNNDNSLLPLGEGLGVRGKSAARRNLIAYILFTAAALYTHYFTVFLLLFHNAVWLAHMLRRRNRIALWLGSQLAVLLLFAPQLALALRQVADYANPNLLPPPLAEYLSRTWQAYTTGLTIDPQPARWAMSAIAGVLLLSWSLVFLTRHSSLVTRHFLFLLTWLSIPLAAYFLVLQRRPSFEPRYLMLVSPAIFLLLANGLGQLPMTNNQLPIINDQLPLKKYGGRYGLRALSYGFTVIIVAALLTGLTSYYTDDTWFKDDSAGVARWLAAETTTTDIVLVDVPHPFHYYAERLNIPAPVRYLFVDIHTAAEILTREAAGRQRLYWVTWWGSDTDPRGVIPYLAEKAGTPAGQRDFKGYHVQWFDVPPEAVFSLPTALPPAAATFGDVLRLDGAALPAILPPGEPVWAALHFSLLRPTEVNYKVSLRLRDSAGQIVGQLDRDVLNDRHFRTAAWPVDDPALNQAINVYLLPLPPETPPGVYQLEAVLYNAEPPYPSEGVSGQATAAGAAAQLGAVTIHD